MIAAELDREIHTAVSWLREHAQSMAFGEIGIRFILHGGAVTRIERTVTVKLQPQERNGHEQPTF